MASQAGDRSLQAPPNEERGFFRAIDLHFWAWPGLLSCFIGISFSITCTLIVRTAGTFPLDEAIADHLVFVNVPLILLGAQLTKGELTSACHSGRYAILLLTLYGSLVTDTRAELQNDVNVIQSCTCAAPQFWEMRDYAMKLAAVTILVAITIIGVGVAGRIVKRQQLLPEMDPAAVPEIQAIPAAVQALSLAIFAVVQGDDLEDVLARAPVPTRLNSPLSWL